jgi:peptidoglycan/xylan/chitin deacetylase (PgdA/CDA1 family)
MAAGRTFLTFATTAECTLLEIAMRNSRNALFGILALTSASGATTALPTEGAELYVRGAYKAVPAPLFSYPYGGTYLRVDYARRRLGYPYPGYPYAGLYYGNYYPPDYAYSYAPPYYRNCYRSRPC